jgi:hypothetical protein
MSWYKSNINNYRFYRIKNIVTGFLVMCLLLVVSYLLIQGFLNLLSQDSIQQSIKKLNDYNSLTIAILTFFLFLVTAFYAWVTLKMFQEQSEQRKVELRPNVFLSVSGPKFTIDESQNMRTTLFQFNLSNFGKGTAINLSLDFNIPNDINKLTNKFEYVSSSYRGLNPFFQSGNKIEGEKEIISNLYELNKFTNEFLIVLISYEDIQRNLYKLEQYYNLRTFDSKTNPKSYILLNKELLFFTSFRYRNSNLYPLDEKRKLLWKTLH